MHPEPIELTCAQVPNHFGVGSRAWLWLGSDNNKGQPTDWEQGIRALGRCTQKEKIAGTKTFQIQLSEIFILPRTVEKAELLALSPETYADSLSEASIVGLNNYSSQVVQLLSEEEFATIAAMIADLLPETREDIMQIVPAATAVQLIPRRVLDPDEETPAPPPPAIPEISDDDPVFQEVLHLIDEDGMGGVLLVGSPGTGKSWYARQLALKLTDGDQGRIREVQFHPSYQYEDFVEGYVPDAEKGFRLAKKHLLKMADLAKNTKGRVVIVIDEFSRTDPARVLGETMTYMEGSLRGVQFYLPSGRRVSIPKNLVFLATMNPEDRSVDEIDAAMERRWAKIILLPDRAKLRKFLEANGATPRLIGPTLDFFNGLQDYLEIGHAFFRSVKDTDSLKRLWENQLQHVVKKQFRFDAETKDQIAELWSTCLSRLTKAEGEAEVRPEDATPEPEQGQGAAA